jgi:hypothetical protein
MSGQIQLFEGTVNEVTELPNNRWLIVKVRGKEKPLGINLQGFTGPRPVRGNRISVQVKEGDRWFFAEHRSLVIKQGPEPHADYITVPKTILEELESFVLERFRELEQVSSDDVHDEIIERAGSYSPKIVGMVFGSLAKKRRIHKVGRIKTKRPQAHAREISVWERTLQK